MTEDLIHISCMCGKTLANNWEEYKRKVAAGTNMAVAAEELGYTKECCKMWMMSPFKVTSRNEYTEIIGPEETLTVVRGEQPPLAVLGAMANPTTIPTTRQYTVVPHTDVDLPPVPTVALPPVGAVHETGKKETFRYYTAW